MKKVIKSIVLFATYLSFAQTPMVNPIVADASTGTPTNKWIFSAPAAIGTVRDLWFTPYNYTTNAWNWNAATIFHNNGDINFNGKLVVSANQTPTSNPIYNNYRLFVRGGILADEVKISPIDPATYQWPDYVFDKEYELKPLSEIEAYITCNKHLPNVPTAQEIKTEGVNVAEMVRVQHEKIEELTLYIIALNKKMEALESKLEK